MNVFWVSLLRGLLLTFFSPGFDVIFSLVSQFKFKKVRVLGKIRRKLKWHKIAGDRKIFIAEIIILIYILYLLCFLYYFKVWVFEPISSCLSFKFNIQQSALREFPFLASNLSSFLLQIHGCCHEEILLLTWTWTYLNVSRIFLLKRPLKSQKAIRWSTYIESID